jgi:hypothetical protein
MTRLTVLFGEAFPVKSGGVTNTDFQGHGWPIPCHKTFVAANYGPAARHSELFLVLNIFFVRELRNRLPINSPVIVISVNPGYCKSQLRRNLPLPVRMFAKGMEAVLARTTEEGSRQLLWAAIGGTGREFVLRGGYVNKANLQEVSDYVLSDEGAVVQTRIWVREPFCHKHAWDA